MRDKVIIYIDCRVQGFCKGGSDVFFFSGVDSCVLHTFELEGVRGIKVLCQVFSRMVMFEEEILCWVDIIS